jgi:hypothetical protein
MRDNKEYQRLYRIRNDKALRAKAKARRLLDPVKFKARQAASYVRHAEKRRQEKRDWRAAHPEEQKVIASRCYQKTKSKRREYIKRWERVNPEKVKVRAARKYQKNRVKILARMRDYEKRNREKINARRKHRYHRDPAFRIKKNLARRLTKKLADAGKRWSARTERLVGCNVNFLRGYLECLFKPGMSWGNYGKWEVDHRTPCANYDLTDPAQQRSCFHWSNLQPLWEWENASKGAKVAA